MANPQKGILGGFSGKVGTVVGGSWNGISYMRSLPSKNKNRKPTQAQLVQQVKFAIAADFFRSLTPLVNESFQQEVGVTGRNAAVRELLGKAVGGVYPNFFIDYSKVMIARGTLVPAENPVVASDAPGRLTFNWTDETGLGNAAETDKAILVAYDPTRNLAMFNAKGAERAVGEAELNVRFFSGKQVHTWISFQSADGRLCADSVYAGLVQVQ